MNFVDSTGRKIFLANTPKRIVSLVPSTTELLIDLGLENYLVGVTKFCTFPPHIRKDKKVVGGTKNINLATIKGIQPDIILCNKEENTKEIVEELSREYAVHVSEVNNLSDALDIISEYGKLFDIRERANTLIREIKNIQTTYNTIIDSKKSIKAAYFIWRKPWMVAGANTFIHHMLKIAGFENTFDYLQRYPEIKLTQIAEDTEFFLLSSEPFPFRKKHLEELQSIFPKKKIILVDGTYFSWHGSRIRKAFSYFLELQKKI